jgi:hypothetical protein
MIHDLRFSGLSKEGIDRTKYLALDYVWLAAKGSQFGNVLPEWWVELVKEVMKSNIKLTLKY